MDVLRTLLLVGLFVMIWKLSVMRTRPIRDFIMWGAGYPLLFGLIVGFSLTIWGFIGQSYGMQSLFLVDNGMVQFLNGAMVILFFSYALFCILILNPDRPTWLKSVRIAAEALAAPGADRRPEDLIHGLPRNGFLEELTREDLARINAIAEARVGLLDPGWALIGGPFRLLFAPAVLLVIGLMLVLLMGVVPALAIPLSG